MDDFTVGDLRRQLSGLSDDTKLSFEGGVTFARLKRWDDDEFVLCFNEGLADLSAAFRKRHPQILAAFCRFESTGERVQVVHVPRL